MIFTWCSRDHHIPASRSTINPRGTRGFHVVFTWFSRGVYGIKKFLPLDQQLTLERIFPQLFCLGQIPVFSKSRVFSTYGQIPGYFQKSQLFQKSHFFQKSHLLDKSRFFQNHAFFPPMDKSQILLWTKSRFTLSRDFTLDKFRILHYPGILPWTNPEFCTLGEFCTILKLPCF